LAVIAITVLAAFAVLSPESGAVWVGLFVPGTLPLSVGPFLLSGSALRSRVLGDVCVGIAAAYGLLVAMYLFIAVRGVLSIVAHPDLTSFPWWASWPLAVYQVLWALPYLLLSVVAFVTVRAILRRAEPRAV
jgi:hypothetical protein